MSHVSSSNDSAINNLKRNYLNLTWYQKLLCPANLKALLLGYKKDKLETAQAICYFFLKHTNFFHQGFFAPLLGFHHTSLANAIDQLNHANLFTKDIAEANITAVLFHHNPEKIADALISLNELDLLSGASAQANYEAIIAHEHPDRVAFAIRMLHRASLLKDTTAQKNRDAVVAHENPEAVARTLISLSRSHLLTGDSAQKNRDAVVSHQDLDGLCAVLGLLAAAGLSTRDDMPATFMALMTCKAILCDSESIAYWSIIPARALTIEHFNRIIDIAKQHLSAPAEGRVAIQGFVTQEILGIDPTFSTAHRPPIQAEKDTPPLCVFFNTPPAANHNYSQPSYASLSPE